MQSEQRHDKPVHEAIGDRDVDDTELLSEQDWREYTDGAGEHTTYRARNGHVSELTDQREDTQGDGTDGDRHQVEVFLSH